MNNGLTAERMMDSFPLALQKDPKMVALAHSIANVLEQRLDEINLGQIYTRIDQLPEDLLDILANDFAVDWYDHDYDLAAKRRTIKSAPYIHRHRGTAGAVLRGILRQVFINILDNAIKYSAPGGRITVKIWQGEYKAFIEIIDQGRGIPPEDLENVKTKFYKGSNSVRGSGIGLALVDSIMTALDGTMDLKSTLGRGTVVTLGLPIYKR